MFGAIYLLFCSRGRLEWEGEKLLRGEGEKGTREVEKGFQGLPAVVARVCWRIFDPVPPLSSLEDQCIRSLRSGVNELLLFPSLRVGQRVT